MTSYIIMRCQGFTEPIVQDINAVQRRVDSGSDRKENHDGDGRHFEHLVKSAEIDNFLQAAKHASPKVTCA